jgi:hypothetical protein
MNFCINRRKVPVVYSLIWIVGLACFATFGESVGMLLSPGVKSLMGQNIDPTDPFGHTKGTGSHKVNEKQDDDTEFNFHI